MDWTDLGCGANFDGMDQPNGDPISSAKSARIPILSGLLMPTPRSAAAATRGRLVLVLFLTIGLLVAEVGAALVSDSLALAADAGHLLTDVAGISLALMAIFIGTRRASGVRTFGYQRLEILATMANASLLLVVSVLVIAGSALRFFAPPEVSPGPMMALAILALLVNGISLRLLKSPAAGSLSMRGAWLEVAGDFIGAGAVLTAGVVIAMGGPNAADAVAGLAIGLLILPRAFVLLRDTVDVLLEAAPHGLDLELVRRHILEAPGVSGVHDLHAWTITSGMDVLSAHVTLVDGADAATVLAHLCDCLRGFFDIEHSTFQLEASDRRLIEGSGHV
jgi:cobalt-zinc-cadmium efflux system protein